MNREQLYTQNKPLHREGEERMNQEDRIQILEKDMLLMTEINVMLTERLIASEERLQLVEDVTRWGMKTNAAKTRVVNKYSIELGKRVQLVEDSIRYLSKNIKNVFNEVNGRIQQVEKTNELNTSRIDVLGLMYNANDARVVSLKEAIQCDISDLYSITDDNKKDYEEYVISISESIDNIWSFIGT